jgi:hypothetical protein
MTLSSTMCQAVVAFEVGKAWNPQGSPQISKVSSLWEEILLLISDYAVSRIEEMALDDEATVTSKEFGLPSCSIRNRWQKCREPLFFSIVLSTSIFRFVRHTHEKQNGTISQYVVSLTEHIYSLYPSRSTFHSKQSEVTILLDPLALPRLPLTTFRPHTFNPYHPLQWGTLAEDISSNDLWRNQRNLFRLKCKEDAHRTLLLPPLIENLESHFFAPVKFIYARRILYFCPLVIQRREQAISVDDIFCLGNQGRLAQVSLLPIATSMVESDSNFDDEVCDWMLCSDSVTTMHKEGAFHFAYRRKNQAVKLSASAIRLLD